MAGLLTRRPGHPALARPAIGIVLVMVLMMAGAGFFGVRALDSLQQLHDSASRASQVAEAAEQAMDALQDSETAVRGYLLTMRPVYLDPYTRNRNKLAEALGELDALAVGSPWLREELGTLRLEAVARMKEIEQTLVVANTKGTDAALAVILTDRGRSEMDDVRATAARILAEAYAERESRTVLLMAREKETLYSVMVAALGGTLLLGFAALGLLVSRARLLWAQSALSVQSDRLQGTVDHIRDGVAVFDAADRLILWNASFFPIAGLPTGLAEQGTPFERFAAAAVEWQPPGLPGPPPVDDAADASVSAEIRVDGKVLEVWRSRMHDGGHILAVTDITRRTRAEAIARQAQKMEALGQLTGGVAHDFNNLLQVISANLELVDTRLPAATGDTPWLRARLAAARAGVQRGARLIQHLLAFARRQPLAQQAICPGRLLRGMEEMLQRTLGRKISVELSIPPSIWAVRVDPQQFENAVLNLAINGRDAIEAAGTDGPAALRIALANVTLHPAVATHHGMQAGDYVRLDVSDSGTGMSEATIARAVEPFFTTKSEGRGTGLGLAMVYGFARQSGGSMRIRSRPGRGTTVSLLILRTDEQPGAPTVDQATSLRGDGEIVVVVEPDPDIRIAAVKTLTDYGYRVLQAETSADAVRLVADAKPPDVLFLDAANPDGQTAFNQAGLALAEQARALHLTIAVVLATGDARADRAPVPHCELLLKPWGKEELAGAVRRALAQCPGIRKPFGQRVVVAEDDAPVRATTAELLSGLGHDVLQAGSAAEALSLLDRGTDVLMTDLGLPDMDGRALAQRALVDNPELMVIIASGKVPGVTPTDPRIVWLDKPYSARCLAAAMSRAAAAKV